MEPARVAHDESDLSRRLDWALTRIEAAAGLRKPVHIPGLFADLVQDFDCDAFERRILAEGRLEPSRTDGPYGGVFYQGETSYHAWFADDVARVETRRLSSASFLGTTRLPLPRWALELQQMLLLRLHDGADFGWSAELFFSREGQASMGPHADNDDVFTIQLHGEKLWRVDAVSLDRLQGLVEDGRLGRDGPWSAWHFTPGRAADFAAPTVFHVRAGDFLATPAFALHEVRAVGQGRSLSFNVSMCREQIWEAHTRCVGGQAG